MAKLFSLIPAFVLTTAAIVYFSCMSMTAQAQPGKSAGGQAAQKPVEVIVAPVKVEEGFADRIEALGTAKANETVNITANVTEIVSEIFFDDGQAVVKGDTLVVLEKDQEEADLKAAQALLDERLAAYERAKGLEKQQALSTAVLKERKALLRQIEGNIEAIQAQIDDRIVTAPFDGILGLRNVSPGAMAGPGQVITTIDDLSRIKVDFSVPSLFIASLAAGAAVEGRVEAYPDEIFKGSVATVGTQVDPVTRTVSVRALFENSGMRLKPGLLMRIMLFKNPRKAMIVPEEALIQRQRDFFVMVTAEKDGILTATEKKIEIGSRVPGAVEIVSGVVPGENVIVHGLMQVKPGQPVTVRAVEQGDQTLGEMLEQNIPAAGEGR